MRRYDAGTHYKRFTEALQMSTHNISFHGKIRKKLVAIPSYLELFCLYKCFSGDEFEGPLCEKDVFGCSNSQCNNNGTCHNRARGGYSCMCPAAGGFMNDE